MNNVASVVAGVLVLGHVTGSLANDASIREKEYTAPLSQMPDNVASLVEEMMAAAAQDKNISAEQLSQIEKDIYRMMGEGAVLQRNHELVKTREKISYYGQFLSWFMKAKGLTYAQIQAKYEAEFGADEIALHKKIINSASRSNPNLYDKFAKTLKSSVMSLFGGA